MTSTKRSSDRPTNSWSSQVIDGIRRAARRADLPRMLDRICLFGLVRASPKVKASEERSFEKEFGKRMVDRPWLSSARL